MKPENKEYGLTETMFETRQQIDVLFSWLFQQLVSSLPVPLYLDQTEPPVVGDDQVGIDSHHKAAPGVEPEAAREASIPVQSCVL